MGRVLRYCGPVLHVTSRLRELARNVSRVTMKHLKCLCSSQPRRSLHVFAEGGGTCTLEAHELCHDLCDYCGTSKSNVQRNDAKRKYDDSSFKLSKMLWPIHNRLIVGCPSLQFSNLLRVSAL